MKKICPGCGLQVMSNKKFKKKSPSYVIIKMKQSCTISRIILLHDNFSSTQSRFWTFLVQTLYFFFQFPVAVKTCSNCKHSFYLSKKDVLPKATATAVSSSNEESKDITTETANVTLSDGRRRTGRVRREKPNYYDASAFIRETRVLIYFNRIIFFSQLFGFSNYIYIYNRVLWFSIYNITIDNHKIVSGLLFNSYCYIYILLFYLCDISIQYLLMSSY